MNNKQDFLKYLLKIIRSKDLNRVLRALMEVPLASMDLEENAPDTATVCGMRLGGPGWFKITVGDVRAARRLRCMIDNKTEIWEGINIMEPSNQDELEHKTCFRQLVSKSKTQPVDDKCLGDGWYGCKKCARYAGSKNSDLKL